ncbi:MAG: DUF2169 domain-containing protein [Polyangiaceae bacterium]|nr:DUF2169 domain-containing protein [Polyangiaceae bacterium]
MILRNYTPFPPLLFDGRDVQGRDFAVLVLRGTFDIIPGAPLRPNPTQQPIVESDVWHGEPNYSSVYMESDLAPFKPRTDILVNAIAHAPGGRPLPDWQVGIEVGPIKKRLRVTGPRAWVREGGEWKLEDPAPVTEVPLRYEYAFGGIYKSNWGDEHIFMRIPWAWDSSRGRCRATWIDGRRRRLKAWTIRWWSLARNIVRRDLDPLRDPGSRD